MLIKNPFPKLNYKWLLICALTTALPTLLPASEAGDGGTGAGDVGASVSTGLSSHIDYSSITPDAALLSAVKAGDVAGVQAALARGANANAREADTDDGHGHLYRGKTALILATELGDEDNHPTMLEIVKLLLAAEADPTLAEGWMGRGNTALCAAASHNNLAVAQALLATSTFTQKELHAAFFLGIGAARYRNNSEAAARNHELVKLLLANGAVNTADQLNVALDAAIRRGLAEDVELLLAKGANPDYLTKGGAVGGVTMLHLAAMDTDLQKIQLLLAAGANPKLPNAHSGRGNFGGDTALHMAAGRHDGYLSIPLLLAAGAELNQRRIDGYTPLMAALECHEHRQAQLLLAAGADPNIMPFVSEFSTELLRERLDQTTALLIRTETEFTSAALAGDTAQLSRLAQRGVRPAVVTATLQSVLLTPTSPNFVPVVHRLCELGADASVINAKTPTEVALVATDATAGTDVVTKTFDLSLLDQALLADEREKARLLICAGADFNDLAAPTLDYVAAHHELTRLMANANFAQAYRQMDPVTARLLTTRRPQPESATEAADTAEVEAFLAAWPAPMTNDGGVSESKG